MKKTTAMQRFLATGELTTKLIGPLGISFEAFLRFTPLSDESRAEIMRKLRTRYEGELPRLLAAERAAARARKAMRTGDLDAAFDHAMRAGDLEGGQV